MKKTPSPTPLRLVKTELEAPAQVTTAETPAAPAKPKSALGAFFTAYADSIDRDVQLILEI